MRFDVDTQVRRERPDKIAAPPYKSINDRDKDLWELCRLSGPMCEIADADADMANVLAIIAANSAEIAELFRDERDLYPRDLDQALREFEARHFGHQLLPAAHGLLMRSVLDYGDPKRRPVGPFASTSERAQWVAGVRAAGGPPEPKANVERWLSDAIHGATGTRPPRVSMDWSDPAEAEERKRALLRQQAEELRKEGA